VKCNGALAGGKPAPARVKYTRDPGRLREGRLNVLKRGLSVV